MPKKGKTNGKDAVLAGPKAAAGVVGGVVGAAVAGAGKSVERAGDAVYTTGAVMHGDVPDEDEAFQAVNDSFSNRLEFASARGKKAVAKELLNAPRVAAGGVRNATGGAVMWVGNATVGAGKATERAGMYVVPSMDRFKRAKKFKYVCVRGAPGAGKGTHAAKLIEDYSSRFAGGMQSISTGELLRAEMKVEGSELAAQIQAAQVANELAPIEVVVQCLVKRIEQMDNNVCLVLVGSPRTIEEAEAIEHMLGLPAVCIFLDISEEEALKRVAERKAAALKDGSAEEIRADDEPEVVKKRYAAFIERSKPVAGWFQARQRLDRVKGDRSIEGVYQDFSELFEIAVGFKKGAVRRKGKANPALDPLAATDMDAEPASCCAWMFPRGFSGKAPDKGEMETSQSIKVTNPLDTVELEDDSDMSQE